jgi:hypothetical protein
MVDATAEPDRDAPAGTQPDPAGAPGHPGPAEHAAPPSDDLVDEMERESFPASDAPSTWAGPEST